MRILPQWWRTHFLRAEFVVAALLALGFMVWGEYSGGAALVDATLKGNRGAVYGALASIFGSLLGFAMTAVSIVLGFSMSERLAVVRESRHYPTLWRVFLSGIKALGVATIVALIGLVFDRDSAPFRWVLYGCVMTAILAFLRLARCIWVLENIVSLVASPPKAPSGDRI
jgi:MFS family permease